MDNWHKILGSIALSALIYIVFMQGCGSRSNKGAEIIYRDTIINEVFIDTIWLPTEDTIYKYITVRIPKPYFDTITVYNTVLSYTIEDFEDFIARPQIYTDSVSDDTVSIAYKAVVWGYLEDMDLGYKVDQRYTIVETRTLETEVTKKKRFQGIYFGMDVGAGKDGLTHVAPMLELSTAKTNYNAGIEFNDKAVIVGARFKIGK